MNEFTEAYGTLSELPVEQADEVCATIKARFRAEPKLISNRDFGIWLTRNRQYIIDWGNRTGGKGHE